MLIVSAAKVCKQCLQTASASGGLCPRVPLPRVRAGPLWGLPFPVSLGYIPQMKIPGAASPPLVVASAKLDL